jgi:hypothetical protein
VDCDAAIRVMGELVFVNGSYPVMIDGTEAGNNRLREKLFSAISYEAERLRPARAVIDGSLVITCQMNKKIEFAHDENFAFTRMHDHSHDEDFFLSSYRPTAD